VGLGTPDNGGALFPICVRIYPQPPSPFHVFKDHVPGTKREYNMLAEIAAPAPDAHLNGVEEEKLPMT
jgi:hypothetical protein